jgi:glutaminyl-peptide cyclotransferase
MLATMNMMRKIILLALLACAGAIVTGATTIAAAGPAAGVNPIDANRAFGYLEKLCAIGPRVSGSAGMREQQEMLEKHFTELGGKVSWQRFEAKDPRDGRKVPMANLIVSWHPEKQERIFVSAHYDTRPIPDQDPDRSRHVEGVFIGANDGASGTALLMEMAHLMPELDTKYGVDFVLFDGEEYVFKDSDPYFIGSTWFAKQYIANPPDHKYKWGVVLDMVGDANLQVYQDQFSALWRDTRPLVAQIWGTADRLGVREFVARPKYEIRDDHVPLRNIAKIPTCDVIDFDYPFWHTADDVPRRCSGASLAKVGWVIVEWLKSAE